MSKHSTRLRTKNGRIALFKNSPLSVTGIGGAILFRNVLAMSSFIHNIALITDRWFPRDPLLCVYSTLDLIMTRLTRLACGFSDFIDGVFSNEMQAFAMLLETVLLRLRNVGSTKESAKFSLVSEIFVPVGRLVLCPKAIRNE